MSPEAILWSILLSLTPISELRGAIPYALYAKVPVLAAFGVCVLANALVFPIVFLFLGTLHRVLLRWSWYAAVVEPIIGRARNMVRAPVEKYGYWGLMLFVAIPFPLTGAYTGSIGAWILGMRPWRSLIAVTAGVLIAGIAVTLVAFFGIKALYFFIKA